MALFKIFRGSSKKLPEVAKTDGYAYFCIDDGTFWIDYTNSEGELDRKQINKTNWTADIAKAVQEISSHTHTYTPSGEVSQPTFTGTSHNHKGSFTGKQQTCSVDYTPKGSITKPNVTVTPSTVTVNSITSVGSLSKLSGTYSDKDKCLTLIFNEGTLPTKGQDLSVITGVEVELARAPEFTGTKATIQHTFTPNGDVNIEGATAGGTVSTPTFTGSEGATSIMKNEQGE